MRNFLTANIENIMQLNCPQTPVLLKLEIPTHKVQNNTCNSLAMFSSHPLHHEVPILPVSHHAVHSEETYNMRKVTQQSWADMYVVFEVGPSCRFLVYKWLTQQPWSAMYNVFETVLICWFLI